MNITHDELSALVREVWTMENEGVIFTTDKQFNLLCHIRERVVIRGIVIANQYQIDFLFGIAKQTQDTACVNY